MLTTHGRQWLSTANSKEEKCPIIILLVDDDPSILEISKLILADIDNRFILDTASGVNDAFNKISQKHYDVIVSDYEMPQKNGLELLAELKQKTLDTPFILFTGKGREEIAIEALNMGADGYYNKQGNPETVYGELSYGIKTAFNNKKAEEKANQANIRYAQLFATTPIGVAIYEASNDGQDFIIKEFNPAAEKIEKISKNLILGKKVTEVFRGVKKLGLFKVMQRVWKTGQPEFFAEGLYADERNPGSWRENWVYKLPSNEIVAIYRDITETKKAQLELESKYETLERVAGSIDSGLAIINKDYNVLWANQNLKAAGFNVNQKCYQAVKKKDICSDCGVKKVFEENKTLDIHAYETTNSKGEKQFIELRATPLKDKEGNIIGAIELAIPISERKKAEDELHQLNNRFIMAQRAAQIGVWDWDLKSGEINWSLEMFKLFGLDPKNSKASFTTWEKILYPEDKEKAKDNIQIALKKHSFLDNLYRIIRPDGQIRWINALGQGEYDNQGQAIQMIGVCIDVTERKNAEEELAQNHKQIDTINQKLQVVGTLTRHDVGNKLQVANSNLFLLKKKAKDNPELVKYIDAIEESIIQSRQILEFSKIYEKIGVEKPETIDVAKSFDDAAKMIPHMSADIVNKTQGLYIVADSLLRQLFYNLIDNSLKHGKSVSQIKLSWEETEQKKRIIYEDDGVGVSFENKAKIFEGFTTGGSGLGLRLIKRIVDVYGWKISEEGVPETGARFEITIPKNNSSSLNNKGPV